MKSKRRSRMTSSQPHMTRMLGDSLMTLAGSVAFWRAALWIVVTVAMVYGLQSLDAHARSHDRRAVRIEWLGVPAWLREPQWAPVVAQLEEVGPAGDRVPLLFPDTDLRDDRVCRWVFDQVAASPWVARVLRVAKLSDGRVQVRAIFREPFAVIEHAGRAYLVDRIAARLPLDWSAATVYDGDVWLRISGVDAPPPPLGVQWPGLDVQAGLKLVEYLAEAEKSDKLPFRKELRSVDVAEFSETLGGLRIMTKNPRSYIRWGHIPGKGYGVEASAEQKLAALNVLYREWGEFPDRGPVSVRDAPKTVLEIGRMEADVPTQRRP